MPAPIIMNRLEVVAKIKTMLQELQQVIDRYQDEPNLQREFRERWNALAWILHEIGEEI